MGAYSGSALIWVLWWSTCAGLVLQLLAARLGAGTGRNLAQMCREGLGVAQDSARAREWFGRAAPRDERARDALREMDAEDGRGQQEQE